MPAYPIPAVLEKYRTLNESGMIKFLAGKSTTFPDKENWPAGWKNDANLAIIPSKYSKRKVIGRVLSRLETMAENMNMFLWRPQLHSTILSGDLMTGDLKEATYVGKRKEVFQKISEDVVMRALLDGFENITASFRRLVFDGSTISLNCVSIPDKVRLLRMEAAVIYDRYGIPEKPMDNIFHVTVARIRTVPESTTLEDRAKFIAALSTLAVEVASNPVSVTFKNLWFGRNIQDVPEPPVY